MIFRIRQSDPRDRERPHRAEGNFGRKALGTRPPDTVIPELCDICLRRTEAWAMIIGEEDLDRRELCDCADGLPGRAASTGFATRAGFRGWEENFYLDSA